MADEEEANRETTPLTQEPAAKDHKEDIADPNVALDGKNKMNRNYRVILINTALLAVLLISISAVLVVYLLSDNDATADLGNVSKVAGFVSPTNLSTSTPTTIPAPTRLPTSSPRLTQMPIPFPSNRRTHSPTLNPTASPRPTKMPSPVPSRSPFPSRSPTQGPTKAPVPWSWHENVGDISYFLFDFPTRIERYDAYSRDFLPAIPLPTTAFGLPSALILETS